MKTAIAIAIITILVVAPQASAKEDKPRPKPWWPYFLCVLPPVYIGLEIASPGWLDRATAGSGFDSRTWTAEEWEAIEADRARDPKLRNAPW